MKKTANKRRKEERKKERKRKRKSKNWQQSKKICSFAPVPAQDHIGFAHPGKAYTGCHPLNAFRMKKFSVGCSRLLPKELLEAKSSIAKEKRSLDNKPWQGDMSNGGCF